MTKATEVEGGVITPDGMFIAYPKNISPPAPPKTEELIEFPELENMWTKFDDEETIAAKMDALGIDRSFLAGLDANPWSPEAFEQELAELREDIGPPQPGDEDYVSPLNAYNPNDMMEDYYFGDPHGKGSLVESLPGTSADMFYKVKRNTERRVFYIDVGSEPSERVKEYLERIKYEIRVKRFDRKQQLKDRVVHEVLHRRPEASVEQVRANADVLVNSSWTIELSQDLANPYMGLDLMTEVADMLTEELLATLDAFAADKRQPAEPTERQVWINPETNIMCEWRSGQWVELYQMGPPPEPKISSELIAMVRRIIPQTIAHEICGVQPMTEPTGLIFSLKPKYELEDVPVAEEVALPHKPVSKAVITVYNPRNEKNTPRSLPPGCFDVGNGKIPL